MKGFSMCSDSFTSIRERLVPVIEKCVKPDMIWLVGPTLWRRRIESIVNKNVPASQRTSDYILLILITDFSGKQQHEWQDQIEQQCSTIMPVITIVMETSTFCQWFEKGHEFPYRVYQDAVTFYDSGTVKLDTSSVVVQDFSDSEKEKTLVKGINKAREFLAGAELFRIRKQNTMAAFMLHQSAEQALRTILKAGMGFHINTHNLGRLLRYACMVSAKISDIFPRCTDQDKRLFNLLQKAYNEARYKSEYSLRTDELLRLFEKVKAVHGVLEEVLIRDKKL